MKIKNIIESNDKQSIDKLNSYLKPYQIILFKTLNKQRNKLSNKTAMVDFITNFLDTIGKKGEASANELYELYLLNYREDGKYEDYTEDTFRDISSLKQKKTANRTAYEYTAAKIPFKGSNLTGDWKVRWRDSSRYYVVESFGWYPIFLWSNNQWFEVDDNYSRTTMRQMGRANPIRYNSGLKERCIIVSRSEIKDLINGIPYSELKNKRRTEFGKQYNIDSIINSSPYTFSWYDSENGDGKATYKVTNINEIPDGFKFDIEVLKAGRREGRRMIQEPGGYIHPSPFSDAMEKAIKRHIREKNSKLLRDENIELNVKHKEN